MSSFLDDYQKLCIARDYAAYRCVGALDAAACYCRQGDAKMALSILTNARADYERADQNLQSYKSHKPVSPTAAQEAA